MAVLSASPNRSRKEFLDPDPDLRADAASRGAVPRYGRAYAAIEFAWFLLFPSLGVVQKYFGTLTALVYLAGGAAALVMLSLRRATAVSENAADRWRSTWATAALFALLTAAFIVVYPISNGRSGPWSAQLPVAAGGSDRDESLILGVKSLLDGRFPYYQRTQLQNPVSQLPGALVLAAPFAILGNAVWQNIFWFGVFLVIGRWMLGGKTTLGLIVLTIVTCPAVLRDYVTGGDLGAGAIAILAGMALMMKLVPETSTANWKKAAAAILTGIALSSRLSQLLLLPLLGAALIRRSSFRTAFLWVSVTVLTFLTVTVPFYWYDPAGFAPLTLHNKFTQFGEVPAAGIIFPALSVLASLAAAAHPGNRTVRGWLAQSGLVMTVPVVFLVALASLRTHMLNFALTDYALPSVFFGGIGAAMSIYRARDVLVDS